MPTPITIYFALPLTLLFVLLAFRVASLRRVLKIGFGDGNNDEIKKALSAQHNAAENIPLAIILLLLLELNGAASPVLLTCGSLMLLARLYHAWSLSHSIGKSTGRTVGIIFTWFLMSFMAIYAAFMVI